MAAPPLNEAFLTQAAETYNFRLGVPVVLAVARDGRVLFRRTPPRSFASDLYELEPKSGEVRTVATAASLLAGATEALSDAEKARRERTRTATRGILHVEVGADGDTLLVPLGERVFLVGWRSGQARELLVGEGFPFDPRLSPDGQWVAFVRDGDLWVIETARPDALPRQLTQRPRDGAIEYGSAEFAAQEELGRTRGYWWSPDSRGLLFQRTDVAAVDTIYVADARHPELAPVAFRYPRAGTANAVVDLGLVTLDAEAPAPAPRWVSWDVARWPYLADVRWSSRGVLSLVVLDREQYELALLVVDPTTGATRTLLIERDDAWINLPTGAPLWLADGGFLWLSERQGAWTLERYDGAGGHQATLTGPDFGLQDLLGLSQDGAAALVSASRDVCQAHVWSVPLDGAAPRQLTVEDGVHAGALRNGALVVVSALAAGGTTTTLRPADGSVIAIPEVNEQPTLSPTTELTSVTVDGRTIFAAVTRPRAFDATRRYPVLLKVYGGPHVQFVTNARDSYLLDQWYADAGFIVVRCDARGTPNRGREWERATLRDLISAPLADQAAALRALAARHPQLDLDRVGVFGWSFGGYFAAMAVLLQPELFKAAVAGAPVTDWELYDTAYTERYMKLPSNNRDGYHATSLLTHAARLTRPLLLIHGTTDDNVHFAHTLALIEALYMAGKRAEVIALSGTHMVQDPKLSLAREKAHIEFFRQHLGS
jgi:dipeptidyl-peptidase 4